MEECVFVSGMPASIAMAKRLRHLDLKSPLKFRQTKLLWESIKLTAADVDVLSSLPALTTLVLQGPHEACEPGYEETRAEEAWDDALALFKSNCAAKGRAPPDIKVRRLLR